LYIYLEIKLSYKLARLVITPISVNIKASNVSYLHVISSKDNLIDFNKIDRLVY